MESPDTRNAGRVIYLAIVSLVLRGTAGIGLLCTIYMATKVTGDTPAAFVVLWMLVGLMATVLPLGVDALIYLATRSDEAVSVRRDAA